MSTGLPMLERQSPPGEVRFHLSLNVDDLVASIEFFTTLFDQQPTKQTHDYAKFELHKPPLVLALEPNRAARGGKLNHLGFRLADAEALVAMQRRLETKGISTVREDGVECCYARQNKFWVSDPDGNLWEMYTFEEDLDDRSSGKLPQRVADDRLAATTAAQSAAATSLWAHRLGEKFPTRIIADVASTDEVLLQGTFNARLSPDAQQHILAEAMRILKPGGKLLLYQLTATTSLAALRDPLPGPASIVESVPSADALSTAITAAGFVDLYFEKLGDGACFQAGGVDCRETRAVAVKPAAESGENDLHVLYRGPFRQIADDCGHTFERGCWTAVDCGTWRRLQASPLNEQFAFSDQPQ